MARSGHRGTIATSVVVDNRSKFSDIAGVMHVSVCAPHMRTPDGHSDA